MLVFYPGDDTPVCTKQLNTYSDDIGAFSDVGAQVLAISAQGVESHERFAAKHGFDFPLLADTDKAVAGRYGTLGPLGFPRRSVFVIDGDGVVRYAHRAIAGLTFRPTDELVRAVEASSTHDAAEPLQRPPGEEGVRDVLGHPDAVVEAAGRVGAVRAVAVDGHHAPAAARRRARRCAW